MDATRHMRNLLFASLSHDSKSSVNAILGYADTIDASMLSPKQSESLLVIKNSGRELL